MANETKKPECYLLVVVGPLGFSYPCDAKWLTEAPEDLSRFTKGEGQALLFKLEKFDCSTEFHAALVSGEVPEAFKKIRFDLVMRYQPDGK